MPIIEELTDKCDTAMLAEQTSRRVIEQITPLLPEADRDCLNAALYILAEIRHAASLAAKLPSEDEHPIARSEGREEILERIWNTLLSDEE